MGATLCGRGGFVILAQQSIGRTTRPSSAAVRAYESARNFLFGRAWPRRLLQSVPDPCIENIEATAPPCGGLPGAPGSPASPWVSAGHRAILIAELRSSSQNLSHRWPPPPPDTAASLILASSAAERPAVPMIWIL